MAERSFRYKEKRSTPRAANAGIYQLVTFDEQQNGVILYIGLASEKTSLMRFMNIGGGSSAHRAGSISEYRIFILGMSLKQILKIRTI